jgi:large subunit ribosomal protein L21
MNVVVDAPEGAFPEGTVMVVKDVEDENTIRNIEQSVAGDFVEVTSVHAVDISFWYNDTEIEPLQPIAVVMSAVEADVKSEAPVVVHVADDGETTVVDAATLAEKKVTAEVVEQFKGEKKLVFKFKKRKRYHRTKGHRQNLTKLQVVEIPA